jgi:ABC-type branched-subunit amino acid transport system substrate-binding protein
MRKLLTLILAAVAGCTFVALATSSGTSVVVPTGGPIQIAVVLPHSGDTADAGQNVRNAVQMAVDDHASIHGFAVQLNDYDGPCGGDFDAVHLATAIAVVANTQNVGVLGHFCSRGERVALPIYESAGIVTISGSVTAQDLPSLGPTVFNRTVVPDAAHGASADAWYKTVQTFKSDKAWQAAYTARFGQPPTPFADVYYDAAILLLDRIDQVATVNPDGSLSINRAALAAAVRNTTNYLGVSCTITFDSSGNRVNDETPHSACK